MNRRLTLFLPLTLVSLLIAHAQSDKPAAVSVAPHVPAKWKAGLASVVVTPEKFIWMAGYAGRDKPADGKFQDLFVKALALEDEAGARQVIVTMDLIGVPQELRRSVARRIEKDHGIPSAALLMNASHTHSGPELRRSSQPPDSAGSW